MGQKSWMDYKFYCKKTLVDGGGGGAKIVIKCKIVFVAYEVLTVDF